MVEPETRASAGQRLGTPETMAISTLAPGLKPPVMPPGRHITARVRMLDETEELFDISQRASGKVLFDMVCTHLNLVEGDYFGLELQDHRKMAVWLDHLKPIAKQIRRPKQCVLRFVVKFFPPDHAQLLEELTRYLFALQIKYDLACGRLTCNDSSAALLVSHIIQSEIGDFEETQCRQHLLNNSYIPDQMALIDKIMEFHHKHVGHTPAVSDFQLLEVARRLEMYGVRLHPAKDREGSKLSLSVAHTGVLVFQGHTKINAFNWSKVRKLSFKRKRFLIKLRPDLNSAYQDTLEFMMASRDCCKVFWKICVEYHAFFRLFEEPKPKPKPVLFSRGSSFRFSGRTQKQVIDFVKDTEFKKIPFERKHSKVQCNSNSPLPSLRSQVPKESAKCAARERSSSPAKHHWKEPALVSAEDSPALRNRASPSSQRNGREDRHEEGGRATLSSSRHQAAEPLNTGPASRAAKGSSSSIPYIDCSDVDSEYDVAKGRVTRSHSNANSGYGDGDPLPGFVRGGSQNGKRHAEREYERERGTGQMKGRHTPPFPPSPDAPGQERDDFELSDVSYYARGPFHSTVIDDVLRAGADLRNSPSRHAAGTRSLTSSPALSSFNRTGSLSHAEHNGYVGGSGHGINVRPGHPANQAQRYGNYSPMISRAPQLQKLQNARNRSDTDPYLLSPATSTPARDSRPVLSRVERMAALERRMMANGLTPPGMLRSSPSLRPHGRPGLEQIGAVQMIDGSTSSGTESSDSEAESSSSCGQPLAYGNPMAMNASPRLPRKPVSGSPRLLGAAQGMVNGQRHANGVGHSPDGPQPSPLTSPLLNDAATRTDDEDEARRKRFPTDKAYFVAKELLTTERTYLKDLEVITVSFQSMLEKEEATPDSLKNVILSNFEPLYKFHTGFLREVEQRLALWEGRSNAHIKGDYQCIGDVMLKNIQGIKQMAAHLQKQSEMLLELEKACRASRKLEGLCRDFELQKVCYVPLTVFLLRPLHRLLHYKQILERLCKHYPPAHADFRDCRAALADVSEMVTQLHSSMVKTENYQKLLELKKDLIGTDNLAAAGREFIRLGCLSKLSGKGLQQRMFFLFNDVLLYTSRGMTATNQFKVHGQLPLRGMTIRGSEDEWGVPHAFTLVAQRQSVVVAASSLSEMEKWMEDIKTAAEQAETSNGLTSELMASSMNDHKFLEDSALEPESEDDLSASRSSLERQAPHRGNTMVHVCWHRNTSVSMVDYSMAVENQLSGNLLRKFKNSNGWQKLWVVFTNFSLFFYKTHQDDYPLASLPLLGYSVTIPTESENIHKDYVFKLHFKSHVYYFRSESEYSFERWIEVIQSATSGRGAVSSREEVQAH